MNASIDLVALSKAGASGLCVVAVFYLTALLRNLPNTAGKAKHIPVRFYILVVFLMSVVLAVASWQSVRTTELSTARNLNSKYRSKLNYLAGVIDIKIAQERRAYEQGRPRDIDQLYV